MKQYWEQLKPLERRWAVAVGGVLFLLLNYFFIWPHFNDWKNDKKRIDTAEDKIKVYQKEVALKQVYETKLRLLQAGGDDVPQENQAIDMVRFYSSRMVSNHVQFISGGNLTTSTNAFFVNQQLGINVQADETNMVNFLYSLGAGNSMVSVRAMNLHPAPGQHDLNAGITMVASYKRLAPARGATAGAKPVKNTVAPTTKPANSPPAAPAPAIPVPAHPTTPTPASGPVRTFPTRTVAPGSTNNSSMHTNKVPPFSRPSSTNKPGPISKQP